MAKLGERAVVLGASMAGLAAARALAEFFETVTVVERDALSDGADHRRGVPQGRQIHALLLRGAQALEELFPGILEELVGAGAPSIDYRDLSKLHFNMGGHLAVQSGSFEGLRAYSPSRPFLESHVRVAMDRRHRTPGWGRGVDSFSQGAQRDSAFGKLGDGAGDLGDRAPETVDRANHEGVFRPGVVEHCRQPGPGGLGRSGQLVGEDPLPINTGRAQRGQLGVEVLADGAHAGIAENCVHPHNVSYPAAQEI